ncbi:MAG: PIG-L family deacetylase [Anaerolineae bacterium]|nr:PIG-L family deacetylase [Anaerolineae bacterium]
MHWIYLSPHLDDVALSAGGLLWEQAHAGDSVQVWTICAGDPTTKHFSPFAQSLHDRWGIGRDVVAVRRSEDTQSCDLLGASCRHFFIEDCIYRTSANTGAFLYPSEEAIFGALHPDDTPVIAQLIRDFTARILKETQVVCPLTIGGHVDHQLTRAAAERLGIKLWYYADFPYSLDSPIANPKYLDAQRFSVSSAGMQAWQKSIAAHGSQISSFWENIEDMRTDIQKHSRQMEGIFLWH